MRAPVNLEKRGKEWVVFMRSGLIAYSTTNYPKAVGVYDYLVQRRKAAERNLIADRINRKRER